MICFFIIDNVDFASYANVSTQFTYGKLPNKVLEKLECSFRSVFQWFFNNAMKANPDKYNFPSSLDMNTKISINSFDIENIIEI